METTFAPAAAPATNAPRHDLYSSIHKALRLMMCDTLQRVGCMDVHDELELQDALDSVDRLRLLLASHLEHENRFVHPAIEARRPGASAAVAGQHAQHEAALDELSARTAALRAPASPERAAQAAALYRCLAVFVGENLIHMVQEETVHNALLWALYSDDELLALQDRLVAHVPPPVMMQLLPWMARSFAPAELAGMLAGMQQQLPPDAMRAVLALVREQLDEARWTRLKQG